MESTQEMMVALVSGVTLLVMLRWILGGARRRHGPRLSRTVRAIDAWGHVEAHRRDTPWIR